MSQVRWYHKLLLLTGSVLVLIILVEWAGRRIGVLPVKADAEYQAVSREVGRLHLPYSSFTYTGETNNEVEFSVSLELNKLGFRTDDPSQRTPEGVTRFVLLGDSFTSDWQVSDENMWSAWLRRELHAAGVPNEVVNLGHPGWGTAQEYLLYRAYASKLGADIVVLTIYVENDIADNGIGLWDELSPRRAQSTYFTLDDTGRLVTHYWPYVDVTRPYLKQPFPSNVIGWLDKNSVIYRGLRSAVQAVRGGEAESASATLPLTESERSDDRQGPRIPHEMGVMDPSPDTTWEQAWTITEALLVRLRDEVIGNGSTLVVVIVPPHMVVEYDTWGWKRQFESSDNSLELLYPHARMLALLSDHDIPTLDPLQTFLDFKAQTGQPLFYQHDRHFNPTGSCLFGIALSDWLMSEGFVEHEQSAQRDPRETCLRLSE